MFRPKLASGSGALLVQESRALLLDGHAARRLLRETDDGSIDRPWTPKEVGEIRERYERVVVVPGVEDGLDRPYGVYAENLARLGLPVVLLGGSFAREGFANDDRRRYLSVVSHHASRIGVRGERSAETLVAAGIENVAVIGTPALYLSGSGPFRTSLSNPWLDVHRGVAVSASSPESSAAIVAFAVRYGFDWVGRERTIDELRPLTERGLLGELQLMHYLNEHYQPFSDGAAWLSRMRRYRFCFGTCFDANLAALHAGVTTLFVTEDTAAEELCRLAALPRLTLEESRDYKDLAALFEKTDYASFLGKYPALAEEFSGFLTEQGLDHDMGRSRRAAVDVGLSPPSSSGTRARARVQTAPDTEYDRYATVFAETRRYFEGRDPKSLSLLSFGCSTGEEVFTLSEKYFPGSRILGVDVDPAAIEACSKKLEIAPNDDVRFALNESDELHENGPYDAIFAMSVLCVWPKSKWLDDVSGLFSFKEFEAIVTELDRALRVGGLLVIVNANFRFEDTAVSGRYTAIGGSVVSESGFVKKFSRCDRPLIEPEPYRGCIFYKAEASRAELASAARGA